jgi:hypothetical protein
LKHSRYTPIHKHILFTKRNTTVPREIFIHVERSRNGLAILHVNPTKNILSILALFLNWMPPRCLEGKSRAQDISFANQGLKIFDMKRDRELLKQALCGLRRAHYDNVIHITL